MANTRQDYGLYDIDRELQLLEKEITEVEKELKSQKSQKVTKKVLGYVILFILALAVIIPVAAFKTNNPTIDGVSYRLVDENGKKKMFNGDAYCVSKINKGLTEVTVLAEVKGKPVRVYAVNGGYRLKNLKKLYLPEGLESFGFLCSFPDSLEYISLPNSLIDVGNQALDRIENMRYNEYDNALYLGNEENPFLVLIKQKNENITSCRIHENTKLVYYGAFWNNESLEKVVFEGSKVFEIGGNAFEGCKKLVEIDLPDGLKRIGSHAFSDTAIEYFRIPNTVEEIDNFAFNNRVCKYIKLPASVTKVGDRIIDSYKNIYCEASSQPEGWHQNWSNNSKVVWGHKCEAGEWKSDNSGYSVLRCKDCRTVLDEKLGN